jgi:hypothetical protein
LNTPGRASGQVTLSRLAAFILSTLASKVRPEIHQSLAGATLFINDHRLNRPFDFVAVFASCRQFKLVNAPFAVLSPQRRKMYVSKNLPDIRVEPPAAPR